MIKFFKNFFGLLFTITCVVLVGVVGVTSITWPIYFDLPGWVYFVNYIVILSGLIAFVVTLKEYE